MNLISSTSNQDARIMPNISRRSETQPNRVRKGGEQKQDDLAFLTSLTGPGSSESEIGSSVEDDLDDFLCKVGVSVLSSDASDDEGAKHVDSLYVSGDDILAILRIRLTQNLLVSVGTSYGSSLGMHRSQGRV